MGLNARDLRRRRRRHPARTARAVTLGLSTTAAFGLVHTMNAAAEAKAHAIARDRNSGRSGVLNSDLVTSTSTTSTTSTTEAPTTTTTAAPVTTTTPTSLA